MPTKVRMKPMLPTLRERKRYLAFEVISPRKIKEFKAVVAQIRDSVQKFLGISGTAKAGVIVMDVWNEQNQRGLIRVNNKYVNDLKASLALIKEMEHQEVVVRSLGVSGILKKAEEKYLAN